MSTTKNNKDPHDGAGDDVAMEGYVIEPDGSRRTLSILELEKLKKSTVKTTSDADSSNSTDSPENEGENFFEFAKQVSSSFSKLRHQDVSAAMMAMAKKEWVNAGQNLHESSTEIRKADLTKDWSVFINSFDVKSIVLDKTPRGVYHACASAFFIAVYLVVFLPATYGVPLLSTINEKAIKPALSFVGPIIEQKKDKVILNPAAARSTSTSSTTRKTRSQKISSKEL